MAVAYGDPEEADQEGLESNPLESDANWNRHPEVVCAAGEDSLGEFHRCAAFWKALPDFSSHLQNEET